MWKHRGMKQVTDVGAIEKSGRRDHRQASGQGRGRENQSKSDRLVRRTGDESSGGKASPQAVNEILKKKLGL